MEMTLRNCQMILKIIFRLMFQLKPLVYLADYQRILHKLVVNRAPQHVRVVHLINTAHFINMFRFLYLGLWSLTDLERTIHFDVFYMLVPKAQYSLIIGICELVIIGYGSHVLLLKADYGLNQFLIDILRESPHSKIFFADSRTVCRKIRRAFFFFFNSNNSLTAVVDVLIPYSYLVLGYRMYSARQELIDAYSHSTYLLLVLFQFISSFGTWFFTISLPHVFIVAYSVSSTLTLIFLIKMKQLHAHLGDIVRSLDRDPRQYASIYSQHRGNFISTLKFFFALNRMYGRVFLANLLAMCPINCIMTLWLTLGIVAEEQRFFVTFFVLYQDLFIFAIHLYLTVCTRYIHRPAKLLMHLMVRTRHKAGDVRIRIRLANDIQALHTRNQYGFTYGSYGLISLKAFTTYLMLYGKMIMISYKLLQQKLI